MKKEDKDIEIHFENGHVPRRQNQNSNISHTAARDMRTSRPSTTVPVFSSTKIGRAHV
mgnify:CR=1 FL=1